MVCCDTHNLRHVARVIFKVCDTYIRGLWHLFLIYQVCDTYIEGMWHLYRWSATPLSKVCDICVTVLRLCASQTIEMDGTDRIMSDMNYMSQTLNIGVTYPKYCVTDLVLVSHTLVTYHSHTPDLIYWCHIPYILVSYTLDMVSRIFIYIGVTYPKYRCHIP